MSIFSWRTLRQLLGLLGMTMLSLATVAIIFMLMWRVPSWMAAIESIPSAKERVALENELLKTAAQIVGGAFLLTGVYFTWQNLVLSREGQITDRFNQAVSHLGSDKLEIRLGGIYALARIAQSSQRDHWPVMQVLCARLREATRERSAMEAGLPVEAQAIVDVFRGRSRHFETTQQALDFTNTNLADANFQGCHFERAHFQDANLKAANFSRAYLGSASFAGANLGEASLRGANCEGVNLITTNLEHASLRDCCLRGAILFGTKMQGAALFGADLSKALFATKEQFDVALVDNKTILPEFTELPPDEPYLIS